MNLWNKLWSRPTPRPCTNPWRNNRTSLRLENLESRDLMSTTPSTPAPPPPPPPLPVLLVIANQDFYYQEYGDTRNALEREGVDVTVAAADTSLAIPHPNSGQARAGVSGNVTPDIALAEARSADYSAIVFVGGWGSSMYQYAFNDPNLDGVTDNFYWNPAYNGDNDLGDGVIAPQKIVANRLINEFLAADKPVAAVCHAVTVLAWARVDGFSPLAGKEVAVPTTVGSPDQHYGNGDFAYPYFAGQRDQVLANGGIASPTSGSRGDPTTVADDVIVDGRIITGENYDSAYTFGLTVAREVKALAPTEAPPTTPGSGRHLIIFEAVLPNPSSDAPVGTVIGVVRPVDPASLPDVPVYSLVLDPRAFAIDPVNGVVTVADPVSLNAFAGQTVRIRFEAADASTGSLIETGEFKINVLAAAPIVHNASWSMVNGLTTGTVIGTVQAQPYLEFTLTNTMVSSSSTSAAINLDGAFALDARTGDVSVANPDALLPFAGQTVRLRIAATNNQGQSAEGEIFISVQAPTTPIVRFGENLEIYGTDGDDVIYVWSDATKARAGVATGQFTLTGAISDYVTIYGGGGSDRIIATDLHVPAIVFGGNGHDLLVGGHGSDQMDGGDGVDRVWGGPGDDILIGGDGDDFLYGIDGDDILVGSAGDDVLEGGAGRDILIGNTGGDRLLGGYGDDILIGGSTRFDNDAAMLEAIRSMWTSPAPNATRVGVVDPMAAMWYLRNSNSPGAPSDDAGRDVLIGGDGFDAIFVGENESALVYSGESGGMNEY